ncbi:MAG: hypothetical protein WBD70_18845 [Mycobacterium sp.]|uniref:hypothetical protein n=1 Tax=Mycobacterium sp. TaxID=1785 RepID=UPI003BB5FE6C
MRLPAVHRSLRTTIPDLWFIEERTDLRRWLTERDWAVTVIEALNLMRRYDRPPDINHKELAPAASSSKAACTRHAVALDGYSER